MIYLAITKHQLFPFAQLQLPVYLGYFAINCLPWFGSPLPEEIGWRGFALPRMMARWGTLRAALLLGVFWWIWHLPLFWLPDWRAEGFTVPGLLWFGAAVMAYNVIIVFIYNRSGRSVWCAVAFHSAVNTIEPLYRTMVLQTPSGAPLNVDLSRTFVTMSCILAIELVVFTRGRLGVVVYASSPCRL